jgi:hypothetical protein
VRAQPGKQQRSTAQFEGRGSLLRAAETLMAKKRKKPADISQRAFSYN